jgi:hypothetical protein
MDDALQALAVEHERKCQVVVLRFFGGLSVDETAACAPRLGRHRESRLAIRQDVAAESPHASGANLS